MNERLTEILARQVVESLPPFKKNLYKYVVDLEDELAQEATSRDQFMQLLKERKPHQQAASYFGMSFGAFVSLMREIEEEINEQLEIQLQSVKWLDLTDKLKSDSNNKQLFYFSMDTRRSQRSG
ncbi:hypothetical protein Q75_02120 [Bacillus coahuilensis p1.1.43]|uniref:Uncharacterized protein n=1 Tax=Bacillus coahuilensis p1.1.43 TaxID=1150625 RepID=A0A147KBP4_9BACI|nr:hypothetical protein [Bacillus coahuilensis]KUP08846.1 hypothetical protein Q75_02120 [Bacillus coahuilensis p1.1.43]